MTTYAVTFRGKPACPCLAEWLPVFEAELIRRGVVRESIDIAQLIGSAAASGGTHASGGAADIWQHDDVTVWVARQMGADATWARTTGSFANNRHTHIVLTDCPHNGPARYQIDAVRAGYNGLGYGGRSAPDDGPRPLSGRTWREGIEWAKQLQEDDMPLSPEDKQWIRVTIREQVEAVVPDIAKAVLNADVIARLDVSVREALRDVVDKSAHRATKEK